MIWAFAYDCRVKKIVLLQKRAIRIIDGSQSPPLFMELNLLKFRQIKLYQTAVFVYKYAFALLPSRFDNYFTTGTEIHSHFTRASKGDRTIWYRTKWHGQNGTDKMVYGQNGMGQNGMDKMVWTKWYGQNGSNFSYRL